MAPKKKKSKDADGGAASSRNGHAQIVVDSAAAAAAATDAAGTSSGGTTPSALCAELRMPLAVDCMAVWRDAESGGGGGGGVGTRLAVTSSSLTGALWDGNVHCISGFEAFPALTLDRRQETIAADASVACCAWGVASNADTDVLLHCGLDTGFIQTFKMSFTSTGEVQHARKSDIQEHDNVVSSISVNPNDRATFVSSSYDRSLAVWRKHAVVAQRYTNAHSDVINDTTWMAGDNGDGDDVFASVGKDRMCFTWDVRESEKPVSLYAGSCAMLCVDCDPKKPSLMMIGDESGALLIDHRRQDRVLLQLPFNYGVYCTAFCSDDSSLCAVGCADGTVAVISCATSAIVYEERVHTAAVTTVAWLDGSSLLSGSVDCTVRRHDIHPRG